MATAPVLSKEMTLKYGTKIIAKTTDFSLEINKETIDVTTLSSTGWKEKLLDLKSWSISFNSLLTRGADATFAVFDALLADILTNDTAITVNIDDIGAGQTLNLSGSAFLTALSTSVAVGDKVTYSGTLEGTGALVSS
jgi:predicted secreted protein